MAQRLISGGAWTQVWVQIPEALGLSVSGLVPVGLATGASYDEDFAVNPANVIGYHGPIDYDSQGYTCSITIQAFVPEVPGSGPWPEGGVIAIHDLLVTRAQVQSNGGRPGEFDVMQFVNLSTGEVINSFSKVMLASDGVQIAPNSFVTANMRFMSVERTL